MTFIFSIFDDNLEHRINFITSDENRQEVKNMLSLWLIATELLCSNTSFEYTAQTVQNCISFAVEKATLHSNLDQIIDTVNLAYQRQLFNRKDYPRITADALKELLENKQSQLYVIVSDKNQICGTILLRGAEISLLSVHPSYQGQGLGLHLLQYAEREAFKTYDCVFLKVIPLFQENLIRYYEFAGYRSFGEQESLSQEKLNRIQEQYHSKVFALIMKKTNSTAKLPD